VIGKKPPLQIYLCCTQYTVFLCLKGRVHYFSMQIVMNKCFLLNLVFRSENAPLIPKNDVIEPKARLL